MPFNHAEYDFDDACLFALKVSVFSFFVCTLAGITLSILLCSVMIGISIFLLILRFNEIFFPFAALSGWIAGYGTFFGVSMLVTKLLSDFVSNYVLAFAVLITFSLGKFLHDKIEAYYFLKKYGMEI